MSVLSERGGLTATHQATACVKAFGASTSVMALMTLQCWCQPHRPSIAYGIITHLICWAPLLPQSSLPAVFVWHLWACLWG